MIWHNSKVFINQKSSSLALVCVWIPLLHDSVVEVLVGEEAGPQHHGQTHRQHCSHHASINDGINALAPPPLLCLASLILILADLPHHIQSLSEVTHRLLVHIPSVNIILRIVGVRHPM